jgi:hypothetical protein
VCHGAENRCVRHGRSGLHVTERYRSAISHRTNFLRSTGAKASRPELDRLVKDVRQRRFDAVLVWKLDRWGRSLAHLVQSVRELSGLGRRSSAGSGTRQGWRSCFCVLRPREYVT